MSLVPFVLLLLFLKKTGRLDPISSHDPIQFAEKRGLFTGVVAGHPDARPTGCVYVLESETFESLDEHETHSVPGYIMLHILKSTAPVYYPGDRLQVLGRVQIPRPARTPGAFDYKSFLENQDVHAILYTADEWVRTIGPSEKYALKKWGWRLKKKVIAIFESTLDSPAAAVLAGLVVGQRPRFHPEIRQIFLQSGTMHVLVASGSNIAFVVAFWYFFWRFLIRIPRRWALGTGVLAIGIYAVLVGADAPIMRAAVMGVIAILYYLQSREDRPYQPLALAAWVLLLNSPSSLFDVGFEMSFLTVFGMVHSWPLIESLLPTAPWILRRILQMAFTTTMAQLWLLPITANIFHQMYPISFISNLIVIRGIL